MATQWYISRKDGRDGPYSGEELQAMADEGSLRARDMVWCEGMPDWVPAKNVLKPSVPSVRRRREVYDDYEDEEEERAPRERAQFPGRLVSPAFLFFATFMFFLPWVDVRCNGFTAASQSGLQICLGTFSESFVMAERRARNDPGFRMKEDKVEQAPLLWFYGPLLLIGLFCGLALRVGAFRLVILLGCSLIGFGLMMVQYSVGFPIATQVAKANADPNLRLELQRQPFPPFPGPMFGPGPAARDVVWITTTPWFWLGAFMTLGAAGGLALEHGIIFAQKLGRRRRGRYD